MIHRLKSLLARMFSMLSQINSFLASTPKSVKIVLVVLTYWTVSITLVFANKYLVGTRTSYDVSLFVAWVQCLVTVFTVVVSSGVKWGLTGKKPEFGLSLETSLSKPIVLMTFCYVGMLSFNNLCLKHVSVSFYQIARSMTLICVVIFSLLILKKSVSWKVWVCCFIVAGGFVLGVDQENLGGTLSSQGIVFGVVTSLFVSLNGIYTKQGLDVVGRDSVKLTLVNNLNACFLFIPLILLTGQVETVLTHADFHTLYFWSFLLVTGVLCFAIAWISAVQIDITSPITHHISANCKAVLQTTLAVLYHGEHKSFLWWLSIFMVIGGAFSYAVVRNKEQKEEQHKKSNGLLNDQDETAKVNNGSLPNGLTLSRV